MLGGVGRRHLLESPGERADARRAPPTRQAACPARVTRAGGVVGVGRGAEADRRLVDLGLAGMNRISRVARPNARPAARSRTGSSVPAWPTRGSPSARRTTGDDVVRGDARPACRPAAMPVTFVACRPSAGLAARRRRGSAPAATRCARRARCSSSYLKSSSGATRRRSARPSLAAEVSGHGLRGLRRSPSSRPRSPRMLT